MRPYEKDVALPKPWHVEEDWSYEVKAADGKTVATSPYGWVANAIAAMAVPIEPEKVR